MPDYCLKKKSNADKFRITLIHQFGAGDVLVKIILVLVKFIFLDFCTHN